MPPTTPTHARPCTSRRPHIARLAATAAAVAAGLLSLSMSPTPALAVDNCPNAALRAQSNSTELPHCRAYETVTPAYMEGFGFTLGQQTFTDDGNSLSYLSIGSFAGNPNGAFANQYVASRTATGWTTTAHNPPADRYEVTIGNAADALSVDLRRSLWTMKAPSDADWSYYLREPGGGFTRIGQASVPGVSPGVPSTAGTSPDLSHVVFGHGLGLGNPADAALWEFVGIGNAGPPRRVSVTNDGQFMPSQPCFRGISADGRVVVFSSECNQNLGIPLPLWARVGGSATVEVSRSECTRGLDDPGGACNELASAFYRGAAKDGSRVFFTTSQQLINADTDPTDDLYACDIPPASPAPVGVANSCAALTRVSEADGARVENVAAISEDGSRAYFVAQGVLAGNVGTNGAPPTSGDRNLYLWTKDEAHPAGQTRFVARLDAADLLKPILVRQMTPDGRYLVFDTVSQLVTDGPGADTDTATDVYRYDAQTGALERVSTAAPGAGGNGAFDVSINSSARAGGVGYPRSASVVTADGSMVVFETAEALSSTDTNGGRDVYLWAAGRVWLISGGVGGGSRPWITPAGRDIFFATDQAPSGDLYGDVYDARVGGGFDLRQPAPCSGDGCQGQQSALPALAGPGGGGSGDVDEGVRPAIGTIAKLSASDRAILAKGGKARLRLRVNRTGKVTLAAIARLAGKRRRVVLASVIAKKAGRVSIPFGLSGGARAALDRRGSLTMDLTIRFETARPKTLTVTLRAAKPKSGKGGSR